MVEYTVISMVMTGLLVLMLVLFGLLHVTGVS